MNEFKTWQSNQKMAPSKTSFKHILVIFLLTAATLMVYRNVSEFEFINFDDGGYVYDNEHVQQGLTRDSIKWAFTLVKNDEVGYWHPVTWLSHMLDCRLFGIDPGYHHLSNLFYHLLNVLLLFLVLYRMTGAAWKSGMVAALFALHPMNVDSVAWIAERKNLLSTTFWMLTMLAYVRYAARPSVWRYLVVALSFTLGLMAKPMLVTLPCALLLLDFWPLGRFKWFHDHWFEKTGISVEPPSHSLMAGGYPRPERESVKPSPAINETRFMPKPTMASINRLIAEKIPLLILSFGAIWLSFLSLQKNSQVINELIQPMGLRISNALVSYIHYLWKIIWPTNLAIFYPFPKAIPVWQPIVSAVALIGITSFVVMYSRRKPYLVTGWFWYLGTLTPVIGLIQGGLWPQVADRWGYVPFIGIFILMVWGTTEIISRPHTKSMISTGIAASLVILMGFLTDQQLTYWKNTQALFQHALNVTRDNYLAHNMVGQSFSDDGNHDEAMVHFQKAIAIKPDYSQSHESLGDEYVLLKNHEAAIQAYHKALLLSPSHGGLYNKIGKAFVLKGDFAQAEKYFRETITISDLDSKGYNNLGAVYLYKNNFEQAFQYLKKAVDLDPSYTEAWYNLGLVSLKTGNKENASTYFQKAVSLNPDYSDAHNSLGKIFYETGKLEEALTSFQQVLRISPRDASAFYNIGIILYNQRKTTQAASYFQKALEINPSYEQAKKVLTLMGP